MVEKQYHIALCTSLPRDLRYLAVLIRSIDRHFLYPEQLVVHFMHFQFTSEDLQPFRESLNDLRCEVVFHALDQRIGERIQMPCFGYWARLWLLDVLPESLTRVLYLDSDMICYGDLSPLWETDLGDHFAGVVIDPGTRIHKCEESLAISAEEPCVPR